MTTIRTRIAPSPTGDPHVGTAYMALFNKALARQAGGQFILRIEDTDRSRYREGSEQQIFDTLRWLGLDYDEGPDIGGPYGPYRQSERLPIYQQYANQLLEAGHAYKCWCTPERLARVREEQRARGDAPGYDRFCLGKTEAERRRLPDCAEHPVVRLRVEDPPLHFHDLIRGEIGAPCPDDQVLIKADGFPTYHFAVVVDDHLMEISHVIRGEEWISSTPKHLLLYRYFGWQPPQYAHFPLLRNTDRSKISKRKNPAARLLWFKEQGFLPETLVNFLALMGHSMPDGREKFTFSELAQSFAWEHFSPVGPIFDLDKLDWLNSQYLREFSSEGFVEKIGPFLPEGINPTTVYPIVDALKERTKRLSDITEQVDFLQENVSVAPELLLKQGFNRETLLAALRVASDIVRNIDTFEPHALEDAFNAKNEEQGWKKRAFFMTLRVATTGKTATPPLFDTLVAIGRERVLERLNSALTILDPVLV